MHFSNLGEIPNLLDHVQLYLILNIKSWRYGIYFHSFLIFYHLIHAFTYKIAQCYRNDIWCTTESIIGVLPTEKHS